ncbi:MAG: S1 RNA-binding domain-containing protein [Patescibacteria group bacterium]|nr:S1 RNA-binding domain-containing protein [Patescibacteria group bacterium]
MAKATDSATMQDLIKDAGNDVLPFKEGQVIEVKIISKSRKKIIVDINGLNMGMVPEKEFSSDIPELEKGDKALAYVISLENDEGFVVLSLKKAEKERFQKSLVDKFENKENVVVRVKEANRGGLIVQYGSQEGFLPSSQLASQHYPKVGNNKEMIFTKLKELIGQNLHVKIITYEPSAGKIIFSEKEAGDELLEHKMSQLKVGDIKEGTITGVIDFGLFVEIDGIEGLVHLSEISWEKIQDIRKLFKVGDKIKTKIISLDNNRVSLSIKRLLPDPWVEATKGYKPGEKIKGKVIKISPFGAFVEIAKNINGLVHISELSKVKTGSEKIHLEDVLKLDKEYEFIILNIESETHKINLSLSSATEEKKKEAKIVKSKPKKNKK